MIYHEGIYHDKRILTTETVKEMQADQVKNAVVSPGEYTERALGQSHNGIYGLGEWRELVDKRQGKPIKSVLRAGLALTRGSINGRIFMASLLLM